MFVSDMLPIVAVTVCFMGESVCVFVCVQNEGNDSDECILHEESWLFCSFIVFNQLSERSLSVLSAVASTVITVNMLHFCVAVFFLSSLYSIYCGELLLNDFWLMFLLIGCSLFLGGVLPSQLLPHPTPNALSPISFSFLQRSWSVWADNP